MKFNEDLRRYVPAQQLWSAYKGELNFEYDHNTYWPALDAECKKRRQAYRERWEQGGKKIGEYEEYLRGGNQPSLQQTVGQANAENGTSADVGKDADLVAAQVGKLSV